MTREDFVVLLFVGMAAGWLARTAMRGEGFGLLGDIALGIAGAIAGGLLFGLLGVDFYGFPGRVSLALAGAVSLVGLARVVRAGSVETGR